jgi:uncharacterized protein YdaU (DUF1376 family)
MNYYERHIGDYARDTGHLSMVEHGAYTLLLDRYYATEKAIPADQAYRLTRARTKEEKAAVDAVLSEFFTLEADGWHSKRCDECIQEYQAGEPDREAKRANTSERQRRLRERRAAIFQELASHGIHPEWNASMEVLRPLLDGVRSQPVTHPVTRDKTATQTPDTRHQTPEVSANADSAPAKPASVRAPDLINLGVPEHVATAYLHVRKTKRGGPLTELALTGIQREAAKAGMSLADALTKCVERSWVGFEADWVTKNTPGQASPLADHNRAVAAEALRRANERNLIGGPNA